MGEGICLSELRRKMQQEKCHIVLLTALSLVGRQDLASLSEPVVDVKSWDSKSTNAMQNVTKKQLLSTTPSSRSTTVLTIKTQSSSDRIE